MQHICDIVPYGQVGDRPKDRLEVIEPLLKVRLLTLYICSGILVHLQVCYSSGYHQIRRNTD